MFTLFIKPSKTTFPLFLFYYTHTGNLSKKIGKTRSVKSIGILPYYYFPVNNKNPITQLHQSCRDFIHELFVTDNNYDN